VAGSGGKLSIRSVARGSLTTGSKHWRALLLTAVVVFVPLGLYEALDDRLQGFDPDAFTELQLVALVAIAGVHTTSSLFGEVFYSGVVAGIVRQTRTGARRSVMQVARTLPYGRLIAVDLLFAVLVVVGLVALVVPGLVFFIWFGLVAPVVEIEDRGVVAAFRRSRELVRGSFWRVVAVVVPLELLTEVVTNASGDVAASVLTDSFLADWLGSSLGALVVTPPYAVALTVMTFELIGLRGRDPRGAATVTVGAGREETE
jgi:hypothetical protein